MDTSVDLNLTDMEYRDVDNRDLVDDIADTLVHLVALISFIPALGLLGALAVLSAERLGLHRLLAVLPQSLVMRCTRMVLVHVPGHNQTLLCLLYLAGSLCLVGWLGVRVPWRFVGCILEVLCELVRLWLMVSLWTIEAVLFVLCLLLFIV